MKDDQLTDPCLTSQDSRLPGREMVSVTRLVGILVKIGSFAIKHVSFMGKLNNFFFVFRVVPAIHHVGDFLSTGDGDLTPTPVKEYWPVRSPTRHEFKNVGPPRSGGSRT